MAVYSVCYFNSGNVSGKTRIGGICGTNYGKSKIIDCFNYGLVTGNTEIGGIAGINGDLKGREAHYYGQIENCYNVGTVTGLAHVGGTVGLEAVTAITNRPLSIIINSYALTGTTALAIGTDDTSTGAPYFRTEAEMKAADFVQTLGLAGKCRARATSINTPG